MNTFALALLTGLTTGGFSCLAVQGGLLSTTLTNQSRVNVKKAVGIFLLAKLFAYTILGAGLGLLGDALTINPKFQGFMQIIAGLFMLATAGRLLNLHPIFRYIVIQPPKFLLKKLRNVSRDASFFAPLSLGALTVFIPCGVTQAMMVLAISTGNAVSGGLTMFFFTLGTSPVFVILGIAALTLLSKKPINYLAAGLIAVLGVLSINSGQILRGSIHTFQNYYKVITNSNRLYAKEGLLANINGDGVQEVTVDVNNYGYSTSTLVLKANVPVRLKLKTDNVASCSRAFTIPSLNLTKILPKSGEEILEFTPQKTGRLAFNYSMGVHGGEFQIIQ